MHWQFSQIIYQKGLIMKYFRFSMEERMSVPVDGEMIILNKLKWGDRLLLLYGENVNVYPVFRSFIDNGLANGDLCLYAFDASTSKLSIDKKVPNLHVIPLEKQKSNFLEKFYDKLRKMYIYVKTGKYNGLRILIDFGKLIDNSSSTDIIDCEKEILRKTKESSRLITKSWSKLNFKHYKTVLGEKFPVIALTAYNTASIDNESIKSLIDLHERVVISTQNQFTALLPNFATKQELNIESSLDTVSEEVVEEFIKKNLENMVLSILYQEPMCGYDVIKTISRRYHVFLNQATIYSTLYSLEKGGILKNETMPDNKTKVFILTDDGRNVAKNKLRDFTKVLEHIFSLLKVNNQF